MSPSTTWTNWACRCFQFSVRGRSRIPFRTLIIRIILTVLGPTPSLTPTSAVQYPRSLHPLRSTTSNSPPAGCHLSYRTMLRGVLTSVTTLEILIKIKLLSDAQGREVVLTLSMFRTHFPIEEQMVIWD